MKKMSFFQMLAYGLPEGAAQLIIGIVGFYSMFFYSDILKINPAVVGTVFLISRIISGFTDPAVGTFVDSRKPMKGGKYIPYTVIGGIIMGLAVIFIFMAPDISNTAKIVYMIITYNIYNISYSIFDVPYGSVLSTLTNDYDEVNKIGVIRSFIGAAAMAVTGYCVAGLLKLFQGRSGMINDYTLTAAVAGLVLIVTTLIMKQSVHEKIKPQKEAEEEEKIKVKEILKIALTNKPLLILVAVNLLSNTAWLLRDASIIYYFEYVLGRPELFALFVAVTGFAQLPMLLVLPKLSEKFGSKNIIVVVTVISLAGFVVLGMGQSNVFVVMIAGAVAGMGWTSFYGLMFGMIANTIEYGEWKNGVRTAGVSYSLPLIAFKVAMGLNGFILGILLDVGKYVPNAVQAPSAIQAISAGFIYIPAVLAVLWLIILIPYKLDKEYPQIIRELEARKNRQ